MLHSTFRRLAQLSKATFQDDKLEILNTSAVKLAKLNTRDHKRDKPFFNLQEVLNIGWLVVEGNKNHHLLKLQARYHQAVLHRISRHCKMLAQG